MKCKSGKHEWSEAEDANRCCNGFKRLTAFHRYDIPEEAEGVHTSHENQCYYYWQPKHVEGKQ